MFYAVLDNGNRVRCAYWRRITIRFSASGALILVFEQILLLLDHRCQLWTQLSFLIKLLKLQSSLPVWGFLVCSKAFYICCGAQSFRFSLDRSLLFLCVQKVFYIMRELKASVRVGNDRSLWFCVCSKVFYIRLREQSFRFSEKWSIFLIICAFKSILHHVAQTQRFRFRVENDLSDFCVFKSILDHVAQTQSFRFRVGNGRSSYFFVCSQYSTSRCANSKLHI